MPFVRINPTDLQQVEIYVDIANAAREVDDPDRPPVVTELAAGWMKYGWDLEPDESYLYVPEDSDKPVGLLDVSLPTRDNTQLVWAGITVHPEHRRRGHGTAMMNEVLRRTRESGRSIVWVGAAEDDLVARAFVEKFGFAYASHDARRRQVLANVDRAQLDALEANAREAAADYELQRLMAPLDDPTLSELIVVTEAINDAPMGELTHEDEKFDVQRLKDVEAAAIKRGDRIYRVVARHRVSGEAGGHTLVGVNAVRPAYAGQGDTAVAREHRGHRLGLLLKIDMMRWLAETEPAIEVIDTWNHADNTFMISVNESIGYRLSRIFNMYELKLEKAENSAATATVGAHA